MTPIQLLTLYISVVFLGIFLEILYDKIHFIFTKQHYKVHHFTLSKYIYLIFFPTLGAILIGAIYNKTVMAVFFIFAFLGTFLEFFVGWTYYQIEGQRLWTYNKYDIYKYTSFLSVPLWGFAGVVFWLAAKALV